MHHVFWYTTTRSMFSSSRIQLCFDKICSLCFKCIPQKQNICETGGLNFFFHFFDVWTYDELDQIQCFLFIAPVFLLEVQTELAGNSTAGKDLFVFLLYISCIGSTSSLLDSASVTVVHVLLVYSAMVVVTFSVGAYFHSIFSRLMFILLGLFYVTNESAISCKYCFHTSKHIDLVIAGLDVLTIHRNRFIRLQRD